MSTGAIRAYAKPRRKCAFRFLLIDNSRDMRIITQDARRRRNVVTGCVVLPAWTGHPHDVARDHGCSVIVRVKKFKR